MSFIQILQTDYQIFLEKVGVLASNLDEISNTLGKEGENQDTMDTMIHLVESAQNVLKAPEVNFTLLYPFLDKMILYFDQPLALHALTVGQWETEIQYTQLLHDLLQTKVVLLRTRIETDAVAAKNISILNNVYKIVLETVLEAGIWIKNLQMVQTKLSGNLLLTFQQSDSLLAKRMKTALYLHKSMRSLDILDSKDLLTTIFSLVQPKPSPFDDYPYTTPCRIGDQGILVDMLKKYGEDVKKIHRKPVSYDPQHPLVLLFHADTSVWNQKPCKNTLPKNSLYAYLVYVDHNEFYFFAHPTPPQCFLVLVDQEDYEDMNKNPRKIIFIQSATRLSKCRYGMVGLSG
jgi:hypothetical protein